MKATHHLNEINKIIGIPAPEKASTTDQTETNIVQEQE
jgi:hypothetical protein